MKSKIKILAVLIAMVFSSVILTKQVSAQQPGVSFQIFYDQLSPYGQWVDYSNYGYVWIPNYGPDFVPYSTGGHWVLTDYGFAWVSDFNWGWAPFHYGRWDYDNYYGWFWVPDNEWGPAWVNWRSANGYYGWSPMEPGISISLSFGREYNRQNDHWIFVRDRDIDRSNINRYYVNRIDHDRIVRDSRVIENTYFDSRRNAKYVSGPAREDVQKVTGRRVNPVSVQENDRPGQDLRNGQLRIYRPEVIKNDESAQRPAPSRVTNLTDVQRPAERNVTKQQQNSNPASNSRREIQQNTVNPQRNNTDIKPVQKNTVTPTQNSRREVQQNPEKNRKSEATKSVQPQNTKPVQNTRRTKEAEASKQAGKNISIPPTKSKTIEVKKKKD
jgi:hypothetical protein